MYGTWALFGSMDLVMKKKKDTEENTFRSGLIRKIVREIGEGNRVQNKLRPVYFFKSLLFLFSFVSVIFQNFRNV